MSASLIITNAAILTMDPARPTAEAIAISGNRISALGRHVDVMGEKGARTRVIDAAGATVTPGFIEAHMHLFAGAAELDHLQLYGVAGFERLVTLCRARHPRVETGRFGAHMVVSLVNDGPVTFRLQS